MNTSYMFVTAGPSAIHAETLPGYVGKSQKGFANGRLGIEGALPLKVAAHCMARLGASAATCLTILVDVEAAFS